MLEKRESYLSDLQENRADIISNFSGQQIPLDYRYDALKVYNSLRKKILKRSSKSFDDEIKQSKENDKFDLMDMQDGNNPNNKRQGQTQQDVKGSKLIKSNRSEMRWGDQSLDN